MSDCEYCGLPAGYAHRDECSRPRNPVQLAFLYNPNGRDTLVRIVVFNHIREVYGVVPVDTSTGSPYEFHDGTPVKVVRASLTWITPPIYNDHEWETAHVVNNATDWAEDSGQTSQNMAAYVLAGTGPGTQRRNGDT